MTIINVFTATALFAPALPFAYVMMFITGIIRLHTSKYEVIYLKRRILPIKQNSINWWLIIIEVISYVSILTNIGNPSIIQPIWYTRDSSSKQVEVNSSSYSLSSSSPWSTTSFLNTTRKITKCSREIKLRRWIYYSVEGRISMIAFLRKSILMFKMLSMTRPFSIGSSITSNSPILDLNRKRRDDQYIIMDISHHAFLLLLSLLFFISAFFQF